MSRHRITQLLTLSLIAAALALALARRSAAPSSPREQDPRDAVYATLNAARAGNVKAYLAGHTGPMAANLRQILSETSEASFAGYLRDSNAAVKGIAVADPQISGRTASVRVEYVYQDRNQTQILYLEQTPRGWKITRTDSDERVKTLIPYGTPVK